MNIINSVSKYPFSSLGENFLLNPNPQHARILKIMVFAFASLAACLGLIYYYLKAKNFNKDDGVQIKQIETVPPTNIEKEEIQDGVNNHKPTDQKNEKKENVPTQKQSSFVPEENVEPSKKKSFKDGETIVSDENDGVILDQFPPIPPNNGEPTQEQSLDLTKIPHVSEEKKITEEQPPFIPSHTGLKVNVVVPQQVPQSNKESVLKLLPNEMLFHLFSFLKIGPISQLKLTSKEMNGLAKSYLDSFEGQLRTFYQLSNRSKLINDPSKKIIEDKKRKECFELLLGFPNLKKHFESKDNRKIFFNHLQEANDYDYKRLFQNKLKIVQDLYFEFATDEKLKEFVSVFIEYPNDDFSHTLRFIDSLENSHIKRFPNLVLNLSQGRDPEIGIMSFLEIFTIVRLNYEPSPLLFDIINTLYRAYPNSAWNEIISNRGLKQWISLRPSIMAVYILHEFTTSLHPNFKYLIRLTKREPISDLQWIECFRLLVPKIDLIEENKRKALMEAIFSCNITARYEFIMLILETKNKNLIISFLKEYLALNHAQDEPEKGLACIFESIKNKKQAIALIQAIQSLPQQLQTLHFRELNNRILLIKKPNPEYKVDYFFGCISVYYLYQDWDAAFQACDLELKDYPKLEGNAFSVGCQNYKLGK